VVRRPVPGDPSGELVRPYTVTGGRARPRHDLALEALVLTTPRGASMLPQLKLEQYAIVDMCRQALSVAEIAVALRLPVGVARVLIGDVAQEGYVQVYQQAQSNRPDRTLLERVLSGLRRL
jgi:hypothetical protein